ncbi:MAG: hypothetical protein MK000_07875 [Anaerolineales bacterium]|nr:hypothetical protein [Anaerolineales bacterium]
MKQPGSLVSIYTLVIRILGERPGTVLGVFFLTGMLVGWMAFGWWLFPVKWKDAGLSELHQDFQREWVQMTSDSFILTTDVDLARARLGWLGQQAISIVEEARSGAEGAEQLRISQMQMAIGEQRDSLELLTADSIAKDIPVEEAIEVDGEGKMNLGAGATLPAVLGGLVVVIVMALGGFLLVRYVGSQSTSRKPSLSPEEGVVENGLAGAEQGNLVGLIKEEQQTEGGDPVARFMTTYLLGDDLYDDSFSIDDANGDFLGECGMGVSDTVGVGDPKKVCAFEIWLFDKNDVRTVTKVLMSEDAFGDDEKRVALEPKGETMKAQADSEIILDTASLHVMARVVDMQYGTAALPENSFFHQLTIELTAWKKD